MRNTCGPVDPLTDVELKKDPFTNKYKETEMMEECMKHIRETYGQHYCNPQSNVQVFDLLNNLVYENDTPTMREYARGCALKYISRYGRKGGFNREDMRKAVHYCFLLMFSTLKDATK